MIARRPVLAGVVLAALGAGAVKGAAMEEQIAYGLIGRILTKPGMRGALIAVLNGDWGAMPGCIAYFVAEDLKDADALWVTEIWESKAAHEESLKLPGVREAIAKGRPLIAGFDQHIETRPILSPAAA